MVCVRVSDTADFRRRPYSQQLSALCRATTRDDFGLPKYDPQCAEDVSNSLVAYQETRGRRVELAAQVDSAADAVRLVRLRYSGESTSYLEVLTTDTDLYSAQLLLAQAQEQEAFSIVQLYVALGGGWR